MNILCMIGLHKFNVIRTAQYHCHEDELLGLHKVSELRQCKCCYTIEELDVHCLGLSPPQYVKTWDKIS